MKKVILIYFFVVMTMLFAGCKLGNVIDDKTNKEVKSSSQNTSISKKAESVIPSEYLKQVKSLDGEWKVGKLWCLPRFGITNKEGASESPIIDRNLIISKNLDVTFDNEQYDINTFSKYSIDDIMSHFNLTLGDAQAFGDDVLDMNLHNNTNNYGLLLLKDNTLIIKVCERYDTDGFYVLERIKN